jgi:hypothetical protein
VCCKKKKKTQDEDEEEEKSRGMMMQKKQLQQLRNSESRWQAWEQKSLPIDKTDLTSRWKNWSCESSRKSEKTKETYHDIMRFFVNGVRGYGKSSCFPYATLSHLSFFFNFAFSSSFFLFFSLLPNLSYYHLSSAFILFFKFGEFSQLRQLGEFFFQKMRKTRIICDF